MVEERPTSQQLRSSDEDTSEPPIEERAESPADTSVEAAVEPRTTHGELSPSLPDEAAPDSGGNRAADVELLHARQEPLSDAEPAAFGERVRGALGRFDRWRRKVQEPWRDGDSLVEISTAVVHDVERTLEPLGGGRKLFPFAGVAVRLLASDVEQHSLYTAGLDQGWLGDLEQAILERLRSAGCDLGAVALEGSVSRSDEETGDLGEPAPDADGLVLLPDTGGRYYEVTFRPVVEGTLTSDPNRHGPVEDVTPSGPRRLVSDTPPDREGAPVPDEVPKTSTLHLTVEEGLAEETDYVFSGRRVTLGRMVDVFDQHGRIRRRNDVAFVDHETLVAEGAEGAEESADGGEINGTVSREHARILYREMSDDWWIVDDRSSYGTRLFRDGKAISVTSRDRRGVRLRSGDLIYLGRAVLRCQID